MVRISKTSKLDGILSWSLQAIETCPGSVAPGGGLVEVCQGCYATAGRYRMANVKEPRAANKIDWERADWVADMVAALDTSRFFRWFDSGDCYSVKLAEKILSVMQATPHVRHWLPTRMYKFRKFSAVFAAMSALPNVVVRFSGDNVHKAEYSPTAGRHESAVIADPAVPTTASVCRAYEHEGKCNGCRACWSKDVPAIAYPAHGKSMHKVIRLKIAK